MRKMKTKIGLWTPEEDDLLTAYMNSHSHSEVIAWNAVPAATGLVRSCQSCRIRWISYLRHVNFTSEEEELIINLHHRHRGRWPLIASIFPREIDSSHIQTYWNTRLKGRLLNLGIDPTTHKPIQERLKSEEGSSKYRRCEDGQSSASSVDDSPRVSCSDLSEAEEEALDTIRNALLNDDSLEASSSVEFHWDSIDRVRIIKKHGSAEAEKDEPDMETLITELQSNIFISERSIHELSSPRAQSSITEKRPDSSSQQSQEALDEIHKTIGSSSSSSKKGVRKLNEEYEIDFNTLHQYSDKKLEDAACILGVSRSTLKRICRKHGILRWPPWKTKKAKSSLGDGTAEDQRQESVLGLGKGSPSKTTALRDASNVMVKVSYEDDIIIKFEVSLSSTKLELEEKVSLRLKLPVGSFSVKYRDEDGEWIFLACDEDLRTCINTSRASGSSATIRMTVSKCSAYQSSF